MKFVPASEIPPTPTLAPGPALNRQFCDLLLCHNRSDVDPRGFDKLLLLRHNGDRFLDVSDLERKIVSKLHPDCQRNIVDLGCAETWQLRRQNVAARR
jgi:hypothetical protein